MKREATEQKKLFTKHVSEKDLYPNYIKNSQTSVIIKWTIQFKNEQKISTDSSPKIMDSKQGYEKLLHVVREKQIITTMRY